MVGVIPMSLNVEFRKKGLRQAREVFKRLAADGHDRDDLTNAIGETLVSSAVRRLSTTQQSPSGESWPQSRRVEKKGGITQYHEGHLAGSILYRALPDAIEMGSPLVYAAQRQFGGEITPKKPGGWLVFDTLDEHGKEIKIFAKKVTQPARPYLGVSAEDADEIGDLAIEFFDNIIGDAARTT